MNKFTEPRKRFESFAARCEGPPEDVLKFILNILKDTSFDNALLTAIALAEPVTVRDDGKLTNVFFARNGVLFSSTATRLKDLANQFHAEQEAADKEHNDLEEHYRKASREHLGLP